MNMWIHPTATTDTADGYDKDCYGYGKHGESGRARRESAMSMRDWAPVCDLLPCEVMKMVDDMEGRQ